MNRIVRLVGVLVLAFLGRTGFRYVLAGAPTGDASQRAPGFAQTQVAPLLERATRSHIAAEEMGIVVAGTLIYALILGYAARVLFGDRLFGPRINGLIALGGAWLALLLWVAVAGRASANALGFAMGFVMFGSVVALAGSAALKAFIAGEFDAYMTGAPTKTATVLARMDKIAQPRGPSQDRMRSAVSRPAR